MADFWGKLRKISCRTTRALFGVVLLFSIFATSNSFAAGYSCPTYRKYTSCKSGYYLNGTTVGNSCDSCPSGSSTSTNNTSSTCTCYTGKVASATADPDGPTTTTSMASSPLSAWAGWFLTSRLCRAARPLTI